MPSGVPLGANPVGKLRRPPGSRKLCLCRSPGGILVADPTFLGLESGTEKKHYIKKVRPKRQFLIPGVKNEENEPLVASEKILLPPLQIKLGLMNFVKAMDCGGSGFQYLSLKFLKVSETKIKEGIFVGPQFRQVMKDPMFESKLTKKEAAAWTSFKELSENVFENHKAKN
ncbi:hypothetical protein AVEN_228138-1 [Araneus ventricosus]|uniref:Uncharacterized protein n=1 Tax=Araneus ventricosus TaxID=182803 RepID=A0A4Y2CTF0_ARAVE|nr:hypothetical protein AVEN_228138-1 [Araneus ventricosus]